MILVYAGFGIMTGTMVGLIGLALFYLAKNSTETVNLTSAIANATEDSIFVLGRDYRYFFINKNHLSRLGIKEGDYRGRSYGDFHSKDATREFTAIIDEVFATGRQILHEHKSEKDSEHYLLSLSPVRGADGSLDAVTVFSKRITGIKLLQEQLRSSSQE